MVTIKDIAKLAGVSVSTVSKALNDSALVKPATKRHILSIAEEQGYQRNMLARQLVSGQSKIIGFVLDQVSNPVFANIVGELHRELQVRGYNMVFTLSSEGLKFFSQLRADCVILWHDLVDSHPDMLSEFQKQNTKGFILGADAELDITSVIIDRSSGISKAVHYLTDLGHRRIGLLGVSQETKVRGFLDSLASRGILPDRNHLIPCEPTWEGGYRAIRNVDFDAQNVPTAFIGLNNLVTRGALHALLELGYEVPRDVSLIGYDNLPDMEFAEIPLTTVGPSLDEMVDRAAELVDSLIHSPGSAKSTVLESVLVARSSVTVCKEH